MLGIILLLLLLFFLSSSPPPPSPPPFSSSFQSLLCHFLCRLNAPCTLPMVAICTSRLCRAFSCLRAFAHSFFLTGTFFTQALYWTTLTQLIRSFFQEACTALYSPFPVVLSYCNILEFASFLSWEAWKPHEGRIQDPGLSCVLLYSQHLAPNLTSTNVCLSELARRLIWFYVLYRYQLV